MGAVTPGRPVPLKFTALEGALTGEGTFTQQGAAKNVDFNLRMGKVQLLAKGTLTAQASDTALAVDLTIPNAEITELAEAAAKVGLAFSPGMSVKGSIAGTVAARGTTAAPQLSGKAELTNLEVSGGVTIGGDAIISGISFLNHVHGGVASGSSNTAVPAGA